ncbi:DUF2218 domain-containing protein [Rhizobium leguminosarum]|uniref:DUF2218 domain-containing protein n=1 Tax=Rhizobium leguminosarum TaxID=384 RepID=UPI001FE03EDB|nr:DUF2218 domain-containing protein [Rhizobium leguminosarum]
MTAERFTVSGVAVTADPGRMLDEICTHFVEHGTVTRNGDAVTVETMIGKADISRDGQALAIELSCRSARALQNVRAILAEHLFGFAGEETLELTWSDAPKADRLPDLREIRVIGAKNITPHMRRVTVACDDTRHFADGGLHFRLLIPPKGRPPVWPRSLFSPAGRRWPEGSDEGAARYAIHCPSLALSAFAACRSPPQPPAGTFSPLGRRDSRQRLGPPSPR